MSPRRPPALETLEFDHLELWVGNAKQAAHYYCTAFGFEPLAYAGPETGIKDRASYVVRQNALTLVFTSSLVPDGPIADHVRRHGDGVRDIALRTSDAREAFTAALARGARSAGLVLTGGGARLEGLDRHLAVVAGCSARVARDPEGCTVRGTALAVDNLDVLRRNFMYIR